MKIYLAIQLLIIFIGIQGKLSVLSPQDLSAKFVQKNNTIPYSVANFGHIPWGRKLIGPVELAEPFDACTVVNRTQRDGKEKSILLVSRGGCSFVTKVRNAQASGVALVMIMDNLIEATQNLIMADDGYGYTVQVPSIFISEQDGEQIENYIKQSKETTQQQDQVYMAIKFDVIQFDPTTVFFALTFDHRETYQLMREFQPHYNELKKDGVIFKVFYEQFECSYCSYNNFSVPNIDCLGGGRYCQTDPDGQNSIANGRQVIEEQLRQICIFQKNPDQWWSYVDQFDLTCILPQGYEFCSRNLQKKLNIAQDRIEKCVSSSFNQSSSDNRLTQQNFLLDEQTQFKYNSGIRFYPGVVVNNQTYLGALDADDIFGEVCNSMVKKAEYCNLYFDEKIQPHQQSDSNAWGIAITVIFIVIVFFLFMLFIYRRMIRREMSREMSSQVNQMVSQYISFYEAKDKNGGQQQQA